MLRSGGHLGLSALHPGRRTIASIGCRAQKLLAQKFAWLFPPAQRGSATGQRPERRQVENPRNHAGKAPAGILSPGRTVVVETVPVLASSSTGIVCVIPRL